MSTSQKREGGLWLEGFGEIGAMLKALQDRGVTRDHLAMIRSNSYGFADLLTSFMVRGWLTRPEPLGYPEVRKLMGENFWGPWEWTVYYGVNFSRAQLSAIPQFPWGEDVLNSSCPFTEGKVIKDTHFVFLGMEKMEGVPLTIMKWNEIHGRKNWRNPRSEVLPVLQFGYEVGGPFPSGLVSWARRTCEFRWYLMPIKNLWCWRPLRVNTRREQLEKLAEAGYELPHAVEEVTKRILLLRKSYTLSTGSGECADSLLEYRNQDYHVTVRGHSDSPVIDIGADPPTEPYRRWLGEKGEPGFSNRLAASRKI